MTYNSTSIHKAYHPELVILIVEGHMIFTKELKHTFPEHSIVFARSAQEAKLRYEESLPNIVFLDIDLPDGNGFELLDYMHEKEPDIYVVMFTDNKTEADLMLLQNKGAQLYIIKPFTRGKIEKSITEYLTRREEDMKSLLTQTAKSRNEEIATLSTMKFF